MSAPAKPGDGGAAETWERRGLTIFRAGETAMAVATVVQHQKRAHEYAALIASAPTLLAENAALRASNAEMLAALRACLREIGDSERSTALDAIAAANRAIARATEAAS